MEPDALAPLVDALEVAVQQYVIAVRIANTTTTISVIALLLLMLFYDEPAADDGDNPGSQRSS